MLLVGISNSDSPARQFGNGKEFKRLSALFLPEVCIVYILNGQCIFEKGKQIPCSVLTTELHFYTLDGR